MWRRGSDAGGMLEGTAVIRASEADSGGDVKAGQAGSHPLDLGLNIVGKRGYHLVLEVRLPGQDPYEVSGRFKVPRRAENAGLLNRAVKLQAGIELPVRVSPSDRQAVEVDWKAFIDDPARKQALEKGRLHRQDELLRQHAAADPVRQAKLHAAGNQRAASWAAAVRNGAMTRAQFEETVDGEVRSGRMDPADAEAARRSLDG